MELLYNFVPLLIGDGAIDAQAFDAKELQDLDKER
jgi:hypothetical protein